MSDEVLVRVDNVSKKFCKSLKRSLWYGMCDTAHELNPFAASPSSSSTKNDEQRTKNLAEGDNQEPRTKNQEQALDTHPSLPPLRSDEFWAVKNVSFELKRGECLGLIGHNGAGKSTLLKMLNGLIKPDTGRIEMHGRIGALIELSAGFNPILTGRENIYNKGAILGFTKKEIDAKYDKIVDFAEIEEFIDMPVQNYSSGMKVRLGFAVSAMMDPDVLIIDEVLAVGDIGYRIKCINTLQKLMHNSAVIFVSHSMPQVAAISSRVILLHQGEIEQQTRNVGESIKRYFSRFSTGLKSNIGNGASLESIDLIVPGKSPENDLVVIGRGDKLRVNFVLKLLDPSIECIHLRIGIYNLEYRIVAESDTRESGVDLRCNSDKIKIAADIHELYLNSGKYSVHVHVIDAKTNRYLLRAGNVAEFQAEFNLAIGADFLLPAHWSYSTIGDSHA